MAQVLHVGIDSEVTSTSSLMAELPDPNQRLLVSSGIAIPEIHFNSDEGTRDDDIEVRLGVFAGKLLQAAAQVGLAGIQAAESAFTFATDTVAAQMDPLTHELFLTVHTRTRANAAFLHRFGYQLVAVIEPVFSHVTGTIQWTQAVFDAQNLPSEKFAELFLIEAQRLELVADPAGGTPVETLFPVAPGRITDHVRTPQGWRVNYVIDALPFETPLVVTVTPVSVFHKPGFTTGATQIRGARPFVLTFILPTLNDQDFEIDQQEGPH